MTETGPQLARVGAFSDKARQTKLLRYIFVGAVNTAFGLGIFFAFNWCFAEYEQGYLAATVLSNLVAITLAFTNYKLFVFRTRGNLTREYLRFLLVYSGTLLLNLSLMMLLVGWIRLDSNLAAVLLVPVSVLMGFIGNDRFSFRPTLPPSKENASNGTQRIDH